jgi:Transposase and inactivated derivatives
MTSKKNDELVMYYEIKRLLEDEHYPLRRISDYLGLNFRTVKKYASMEAEEFERFVVSKHQHAFELAPYKEYIVSKLREHPDIPATVIHDKLKEHFVDFPDVHSKTVYNYVMKLRGEYGMPKVDAPLRQYFPVADLSPGDQAQVDFGEKKLRTGIGNYVTVYFFVMILCFSRYKYILFRDSKFTSVSSVQAHEKAFEFFGGIPREIIYDQDCVFIHDENRGDYVMTDIFSRYVSCRPFKVTFCRAADPESKGKVENVVKYVKNNFLYNRQFSDIATLNSQAIDWLERTGNKMVHNTTRKVPVFQWKNERDYLLAWHPVFTAPQRNEYKVHKTNIIKYKGNIYSLPFGTYQGEDHRVFVNETDGSIVISDKEEKILATHLIPEGTGHTVINTHHRRNTTIRLNDLRSKVREFFRHTSSIEEFISQIERLYPRYVRDQLTLLLTSAEKAGIAKSEIALDYCLSNNITSCNDFKVVLDKLVQEKDKTTEPAVSSEVTSLANHPVAIKPMGDASVQLISMSEPEKSDIREYESLFTDTTNKSL